MTTLWLLIGMTALTANPEAQLLFRDGSHLPGQPLGRSPHALVWQFSDGSGYAEVPIPLETVDSIQWHAPATTSMEWTAEQWSKREPYLDLLAPGEKERVFELMTGSRPTGADEQLRLVDRLRRLREGQISQELFHRAVEEECVALIDLGLANVAVNVAREAGCRENGSERTPLVCFAEAVAAAEEGKIRSAARIAVTGFMCRDSGFHRWRGRCAGLAAGLMEELGLSANADLLLRSAKSQGLDPGDFPFIRSLVRGGER